MGLTDTHITQEFQLLGSASDALEYQVGLYYFWEQAKEDATPLHRQRRDNVANPFTGPIEHSGFGNAPKNTYSFVAAWGKNLMDNNYEAFTLDNQPQASRAVIWGDGRSYGIGITYRYL